MVTAPPLEHDLNYLRKLTGLLLIVVPVATFADLHVVVIEGLGGEPRYTEQFDEQLAAIVTAAKSLTTSERIRVFRADKVARDDVLQYFEKLQTAVAAADQFALYLIGHGSYDDHEYKFNIRPSPWISSRSQPPGPRKSDRRPSPMMGLHSSQWVASRRGT